jgi:hypothetical protein
MIKIIGDRESDVGKDESQLRCLQPRDHLFERMDGALHYYSASQCVIA